jgi:hypothetical protein
MGIADEYPTKKVFVSDYGVTDVRDTTLSTDSAVRKEIPICRGVLDYFPAAFVELAKLAEEGNRKHNPGEELHWARGKSMDHADCIVRHLIERGVVDTDGFLHDVKVAWRALALLQEALEKRGAPLPRGARQPVPTLKASGHEPDRKCLCNDCYSHFFIHVEQQAQRAQTPNPLKCTGCGSGKNRDQVVCDACFDKRRGLTGPAEDPRTQVLIDSTRKCRGCGSGKAPHQRVCGNCLAKGL